MKQVYFFLIPFLLFGWHGAVAQVATQTVKGRIIDQDGRYPLPGVQVMVMDANPAIVASTNDEGYYYLKNVPVGRQTLRFVFIGYKEQIVPNVMVNSGKETELNLGLEESLLQGETVELVGESAGSKGAVKNEFAHVSARSFNAEETQRFAGSRADPARMATNFAGVSGANDGRNDIIIRGNSPSGVLWRMDGADIPNPSHFGALGATGGPVGMLNNNVLDKSDFLTSAWPSMYGNALSGVFDLSMRNGNRDKHEFLGQVGFNGFELGAEGPLSKGDRGSYLINYRYSTLGVFKAMGLNFGTGAAVPEYQDLSFKVNLPVGNNAVFSLFGVGGISAISFRGTDADSSTNFYSNDRVNNDFNSSMGTIGANYLQFYSKEASGKLTLSLSGNSVKSLQDSLNSDKTIAIPQYRDNSNTTRMAIRYTYNHKLSARATLNAGIFADRLGYSFNDSIWLGNNRWQPLRDESGSTWLMQSHATLQYKVSEKLVVNAGLHAQSLTLNEDEVVVEPRAGLRYQLTPRQSISLGYGMHSQVQPLAAYFYKTDLPNGQFEQTNLNLGMTRSHHFVAGHTLALGEKTRLKTEAYYQHLYNVPVDAQSSSFSILNFGADFNYPDFDSLSNTGTGRNYGLEFTLERNFADGYYLLSTLSLFESEYQGSDGVWRNTAFNTGAVFNVVAGAEWKIGEKRVLTLDFKQTASGGRRYTPINVEESIAQGQAVYFEDRAWEEISIPYLRTDVKVGIRTNRKNYSSEFFIDVQNIFNRANVFAVVWDENRQQEAIIPQLGIFPVPTYRVTF